jgi:hypothetical protein
MEQWFVLHHRRRPGVRRMVRQRFLQLTGPTAGGAATRFMPATTLGFSIPPCVSIDNSPNDNGALACDRQGMPTAMAHGSIDTAVSNLLSCSGPAALFGHGCPGDISAGSGNTYTTPDQELPYYNYSYWKPKLSGLAGRYLC